MKKKEKDQIRALSVTEVNKHIVESEHKLAEMLRDRLTKQMKNVHEVKKLRKQLAVLKTVARQKELAYG